MSIARSFGPVAEQMSEALEQYSKEELRDLLTHIVKTYVVQGTLPLKPEVGTVSGEEHLASLTFPQLILHFQMRLDHREWSVFSVSGEDVWVSGGGQRINLTSRQSAMPHPPAAAAEQQPPESAAPALPVRQPAPEPPLPPSPSAAPAAPPAQPPASMPASDPLALEGEAESGKPPVDPFEPDVEASERFGMLEID